MILGGAQLAVDAVSQSRGEGGLLARQAFDADVLKRGENDARSRAVGLLPLAGRIPRHGAKQKFVGMHAELRVADGLAADEDIVQRRGRGRLRHARVGSG